MLAIVNRVTVKDDGQITWNGKPISTDQLSAYSAMVSEMNPVPFTILQVENGASCSDVRRIRQAINERAQCADEYAGHCGEGPDPWARLGDVVGQNGETSKFYPDRDEAPSADSSK